LAIAWLDIIKLGQIAQYLIASLKKHFCIMGEQLYWHDWGID